MDDLIQYGHHTLHQLTLTPKKREKSLVTNMTSFCLLPLLQRDGGKKETLNTPPLNFVGVSAARHNVKAMCILMVHSHLMMLSRC
jgi:hypothetical protein